MATKITTPELFNLSSNNTAATQLPVFTTSTRPTPTTSTVTVDYLVVGGGGGTYAGGGANYIGGGGAGGLRTSYGSTSGGGAVAEPSISLSTAKSYAITVGPASLDGEDSVFGSITSLGGGRSGATASTAAGSSGGSGGGASGDAYNAAGGSGTANQGYSGGNSGPSCSGGSCRYPGGGGGGAASAGANATTTTAGNGGNGLEVNIIGGTGNYYAGGGGGSSYLSGAGTGGLGGGGNGSARLSGSEVVNNGATNTGGGGGGGLIALSTPALGGSGIVILRYPTSSSLNIITTGSLVYTESTDGSDTVLQFTEGSGNFGFAANNITVGEMIFNSTTGKVEYWDGFQWNMIKDEAGDYTSNLLTWIDVGPGKSWSGSGSLMTDLSGNGNNFTLSGQSYTAGNNYVTLPNSSAYATSNISMTYNVPKTLLMWHKISINSGYSTAFGTNSASYYSYILYGNATGTLPDESVSTYTNYNVTSSQNGLVRNGHYAYTDNTWRMMALVEDTTNWPNNTLLFYMNGSLVSQSSTGKYWSVDKLAIGRLGSTASGYFFGDVGEWRVYSESLTADKILAIYNATKAAYGL